LHDFAALRAINNVTIVAPADNFETREAVLAAAQTSGPVYLRFGKKRMSHLPRLEPGMQLGRASAIREGTDIAFLACGETVGPAFEAGQLLAGEGIECRVLSLHTIKPLDESAVLKAGTETGGVITVEEHSVHGGLGEACAALLMQRGVSVPFKIVGFPDEYTVTGSQDEILKYYGIDGPGLAETARRTLAKR
jgi:transketolase